MPLATITSSKELINNQILKKFESIYKSRENPSTHQRTMSPAPTPVQNTVVVDSETESESEIKSHPDNEFDFYVGNQLGLPSPPFEPDPTIPPFDPTLSNELNSNSEFFEVFTLPHRFLPESAGMTRFRRIPAELYLAEGPAKFAIPGTTYSGGIEPFRNWHRNVPRNAQERNATGIWSLE